MQLIQKALPQVFEIFPAQLVEIATEYWRMSRWLAPYPKHPNLLPLRHTVRRLEGVLQQFEIRLLDLTGQPYDEGLSVEVLDTLQQERVAGNLEIVITEMIAPVIFWQEILLKPGKVVITRYIQPEADLSIIQEEQAHG